MEPDDLYGLPLERFTEERNALAKTLRKEGRRQEEAEIARLRKPSVAAWAVNQLVRTQHREIAALFEAGDALREAQSRLLAGRGEADALRDAVENERAAVDRLTNTARGLLSAEGHELTSATLERVSETLHAAALDEDARTRAEGGCLERELHRIGLGVLGEAAPRKSGRSSQRKPSTKTAVSGARAQRQRQKPARPARAAAARKSEGAAARKAEGAAARKAESAAARKAEAGARRRAERTAKELKTAQSRRDCAAAEFRHAQETLRNAGAALASAERAAADAVSELEALRRARERG